MKERFALLIPHIVSRVERELIDGVSDYLKTRDCTLFIITGISNFSDGGDRDTAFIHGIHNIYNILAQVPFDGVLYDAGDFVISETKEKIYQILQYYDLSTLVIEEEHEGFESIFPEQTIAFERMTHHMIWEHDCRHIYFLAGFKGNPVSEQRQKGFEIAMKKNGLPVTSESIYYGNFWIEKPTELARRIANGDIAMPDAVICASDMMAISLIDTLKECGIRVPDDIRVTGCDGITEALLHDPPLTTITGRSYQLGYDAAARLYHKVHPDCTRSGLPAMRQKLHFGTSCGCTSAKMSSEPALINEMRRINAFHLDRYQMMATSFFQHMTDVHTLKELMLQTARYSYRLPNWQVMYVCMCEDWTFDFTNPASFREEGFSDQMICGLEKYRNVDPAHICQQSFPTSDLIPAVESEMPVYLVTSLHNQGRIYGYICTGYASPGEVFLDDNYMEFTDAICRGAQEAERELYRIYVQNELENHFDRDPETGFLSKNGFERQLRSLLGQGKNCAVILMKIEEDKGANPFDLTSILSSAIRDTAYSGELDARLNSQVYAIAFPTDKENLANSDIQERIDAFENEILFYETNHIHLSYPFNTAVGSIFHIGEDISKMLEEQLRQLQERFQMLRNNPANHMYAIPELRRQMKREPYINISADEASEKLHLSRSHFYRLYQQIYGLSFHKDVMRIRLDRARYLLKHTDKSVSEIAELCGYESGSHFMRQFRKVCGMTALQFRKGMKE